jgi:hypothetical protein
MATRTIGTIARIVIPCAAISMMSSQAWAGGRPPGETQNWFGYLQGGYGFAEGDTRDNLDDGWTLSGGAMFWPVNWPVGLDFGLGYADFDLSSNSIQQINDAVATDPSNSGQITGGDVTSWQLTVNATWGPGRHDNGLYVTAGVGAYYLTGRTTSTGLVYYPPVCDPWYWWWCYSGGVGPGTVVTGKETSTQFGANVGIGGSFAVGDGQLFVEAKYTMVNTERSQDLTFLPVTVGFRW